MSLEYLEPIDQGGEGYGKSGLSGNEDMDESEAHRNHGFSSE